MKKTKNKNIILKTIFIFVFISLFIIPDQTTAASKYFYTKEELSGKKIEEGNTNSGFDTKEACTKKTSALFQDWKPSVCYTGNNATITSISPASGKPGDIITINGTSLNYIDSVSFNGIDAGYSNIYIQTQIKVTIPSGATSGPIKINTRYRGTATSQPFTIKNDADTYWWYLNTSNEYYGSKGRLTTPGFTDENTCNAARLAYEKSSSQARTMGPCFQDTETKILKDKADSYKLDAQGEAQTTDSTYKLLAPLPGLSEIKASDNIGKYFNIMVEIAIGLCAVLAVIMLVIGGIQYMGDESIFGKTKGKEQMIQAIFGLLIAVGSYALLNTISPDLLGAKGLNIKQVSAEIQEEKELIPWEGTSIGANATTLCKEGYTNVNVPWAGTNDKKFINVCKSISINLSKMLTDARAAGYYLTGSGYRTKEEQQALRVEHGCADPKLGSGSCTPQTAQPGHSKHESGKAVDFRCNSAKMTSTSVCFIWLKNNASNYTFYNLGGEPWHWSDDGH